MSNCIEIGAEVKPRRITLLWIVKSMFLVLSGQLYISSKCLVITPIVVNFSDFQLWVVLNIAN